MNSALQKPQTFGLVSVKFFPLSTAWVSGFKLTLLLYDGVGCVVVDTGGFRFGTEGGNLGMGNIGNAFGGIGNGIRTGGIPHGMPKLFDKFLDFDSIISVLK